MQDETISFSNQTESNAALRFVANFLNKSGNRLTGLLLAKLDAFNRIGTTFGEKRSVRFCKTYSEQLRSLLPPGTPVIRMSERRFAILLALDSMTTIIEVASRLAEQHPPQFQKGDDKFFVDLTLGVAVHPTHADTAASLFRRAELAMNEARARDVNFEIYRPDSTQQQAAIWKFSSDLETAIKQGAIELYLQPKVGVHTGAMVGAEALVRWRRDSGQLVLPGEFVPVAERSGSVVPLTWLVFDKLAALVARWPILEEEWKIAVNVSSQVFDHVDFVPRVAVLREKLEAAGVGLILELTEESLITNAGNALARLNRLRQSGIELAIDDFGRGYSSLSYLKDIPANEIKIDKSFVASAYTNPKDRHIIKATTELAHAFEMRVVGEGVDSLEALSVLNELGCEIAQGFYIARPMRADLLIDWARAYAGLTGRNRLLNGAAGKDLKKQQLA